jgi:hypothetical protein
MSKITHWDNCKSPYWGSWPEIKKYLLAGGYTEAGLKRYFVVPTQDLGRVITFFKREWQIEIWPNLHTHEIGPVKRGVILPIDEKIVFNMWPEGTLQHFTEVPVPYMKALCAHGILNSLSILNPRGSYAFIYDDDLISLWEKDVLDVVRGLRASALTLLKVKPDADLGASRRKQLQSFAEKYGEEKRRAAALRHKLWIEEACRVWAKNKHLPIRQTAVHVVNKLKHLTPVPSYNTVRKVIARFRPPNP